MQPFSPFPFPREISLFPLAEKELSSPRSHLLLLQNVGKENPEEPTFFPDVGEGNTR